MVASVDQRHQCVTVRTGCTVFLKDEGGIDLFLIKTRYAGLELCRAFDPPIVLARTIDGGADGFATLAVQCDELLIAHGGDRGLRDVSSGALLV